MRLTLAATLACSILAHHAMAQNVVMSNNANHPPTAPDKPRSITVTFQITVPAPAVASPEDITKAVAASNQSLYDIINHECSVLTAALKGSCRLGRLNVSGNFNEMNFNPMAFANRGNANPMVSANASATFEIDMEHPTGDTPPAPAAAPKQ